MKSQNFLSLLGEKNKKVFVMPEGYDKIIVSATQMEKIEKWYEANYNIENGGFPLEKGVIELEVKMNRLSQETYLQFELHEKDIHVTLYDAYGDIIIEFHSYIYKGKIRNKIVNTYDLKKYKLEKEFALAKDKLMLYSLNIFMQVSYFMINFMEDNEIVQIKESNYGNTITKGTEQDGKNSRKIGRKTYKFRIRENLPKREYHAKTMAWTRRGHWRYLKDGRKVFVKQTVVRRKPDAQAETGEYKL
ncbi:hypothetical protein [Bacillus thuringiensis]|uniref:hypothetical protein n=1 Tax=Bacillus thuringiensis TaxID=1428 RepID=UPI0011AB1A9E|nr:hypothetical protein [Bacillus thuringiensis]